MKITFINTKLYYWSFERNYVEEEENKMRGGGKIDEKDYDDDGNDNGRTNVSFLSLSSCTIGNTTLFIKSSGLLKNCSSFWSLLNCVYPIS